VDHGPDCGSRCCNCFADHPAGNWIGNHPVCTADPSDTGDMPGDCDYRNSCPQQSVGHEAGRRTITREPVNE
jgi:hypothetical protein